MAKARIPPVGLTGKFIGGKNVKACETVGKNEQKSLPLSLKRQKRERERETEIHVKVAATEDF